MSDQNEKPQDQKSPLIKLHALELDPTSTLADQLRLKSTEYELRAESAKHQLRQDGAAKALIGRALIERLLEEGTLEFTDDLLLDLAESGVLSTPVVETGIRDAAALQKRARESGPDAIVSVSSQDTLRVTREMVGGAYAVLQSYTDGLPVEGGTGLPSVPSLE